jgi:NitT/TauT family transport system ATP-binding protein
MISIRHLHKRYQTAAGTTEAIRDVSFDVHDGEFVSVVGPSGAGKSTLLKSLIGLQPATSGSVSYLGKAITGPHPDFALVFQDYARSLYPWLSLVRNITLPLENRIPDAAEREHIAHTILARVGLPGVGNKRPSQLSGGQQQRVAIARALAYSPKVLIMDEPFASVDAQTRFDLEDLVLRLAREAGSTVILVTHDIDEAVYMSDRVVVLSRAPSIVVEEIDVPLGLLRDQINTRALPAYAGVRARVLGLIRDQRSQAAA